MRDRLVVLALLGLGDRGQHSGRHDADGCFAKKPAKAGLIEKLF